jgi:hypothetical protein
MRRADRQRWLPSVPSTLLSVYTTVKVQEEGVQYSISYSALYPTVRCTVGLESTLWQKFLDFDRCSRQKATYKYNPEIVHWIIFFVNSLCVGNALWTKAFCTPKKHTMTNFTSLSRCENHRQIATSVKKLHVQYAYFYFTAPTPIELYNIHTLAIINSQLSM